jgi:pyruvate/2-oxoglutarate dehydrogenase complex dihydrolipoamide acyltransferase (E2) component
LLSVTSERAQYTLSPCLQHILPSRATCLLLRVCATHVQQGDSIKKGQHVGYVEQLGTFVPIESPQAGEIVQFVVEDGKPVEYGEVGLCCNVRGHHVKAHHITNSTSA